MSKPDAGVLWVVAAAALIVLLVLLYEWVGSTLLDTGGTVG